MLSIAFLIVLLSVIILNVIILSVAALFVLSHYRYVTAAGTTFKQDRLYR